MLGMRKREEPKRTPGFLHGGAEGVRIQSTETGKITEGPVWGK